MADIFLSYSSADRAAAERVQAALSAAGYDVFWDQEVEPGDDWNTWIGDKLKASSIVIVLWSAVSVRSGNVVHEASIAHKKKKLIPAYIDDLDVADYPMGFYTVQAVDLRKFAGGPHPGMNALLKAVRGRIGGRGLFASVADTFPDRPPPPKKPLRRKVNFRVPRLAVGAAALVLGMVFVFGAANVLTKVNFAQPFSSVPRMLSGIGGHKTLQDCEVCPTLVEASAGSFEMGSPLTDRQRFSDEREIVPVTFSEGFAIGQTEVTFVQWDACVEGGGCERSPPAEWGREGMPVIHVSWDQAKKYAAWLKKITGKNYRLPKEEEWEYAARAGTETPYWWGDSADHAYANFGDQKTGVTSGADRWRYTSPVKSFKPNAWGLYDTSGNVWEWVQDCWVDHSSTNAKPDCGNRVIRGGSWVTDERRVRSAARNMADKSKGANGIGFRVLRELDAPR